MVNYFQHTDSYLTEIKGDYITLILGRDNALTSIIQTIPHYLQ